MSETASNVSQTAGRAYVPGASVKVLYEEKIALQPCCLQFSPRSPEYFVVGTYSLEDTTTQSRNGSLLLYRLHGEKLILFDTAVRPSGILDLRFNNPKSQEAEKFAVVSSSGSISIFKFKAIFNGFGGEMGEIIHLNTFQVFPESTVVTSLAWHSSSNGPIAVTTSEGQVSILNFRDNYTVLNQHAVVNVHGNNEAWTVAFSMDVDYLDAGQHGAHENILLSRRNEYQRFVSPFQGVYSGGDDSRLRFAKFSRNEEGHTVPDRPAFSVLHGGANGMRGHNAGVTAILPLPFHTKIGEDILITGSYDDHVRVYAVHDHRLSEGDKKPKVLAELNVGGGVWRLTFLEDYTRQCLLAEGYIGRETDVSRFRILASCMQGGVRILEIRGSLRGEWSIKVIAELKFNTTDDLVYAGDVQPVRPHLEDILDANEDKGHEEFICVSANFYEKQLCVWKYYIPGLERIYSTM